MVPSTARQVDRLQGLGHTANRPRGLSKKGRTAAHKQAYRPVGRLAATASPRLIDP